MRPRPLRTRHRAGFFLPGGTPYELLAHHPAVTVILLLLAAMTSATAATHEPPVPQPTPPPGGVTAVIVVPPAVLLAQRDPPPGLVEMLQRDEGLRLKLYRDSRRNWTVGYGRNITGRGITEAEALYLLQNDIRACQLELDTHLAWWRLLNTQRQMAMLSLCYNLGIYGLLDFKVSLAEMEAGRYKEAARQFLHSRWAKQVGHRAGRIAALIDPGRAAAAPPNRPSAVSTSPKRRSERRRTRSQKPASPVGRQGRQLR